MLIAIIIFLLVILICENLVIISGIDELIGEYKKLKKHIQEKGGAK